MDVAKERYSSISCAGNAFIVTFQYLEWIRGDIYDVFSPKDSKSGLKNIKKFWDHGPTWPRMSILLILLFFGCLGLKLHVYVSKLSHFCIPMTSFSKSDHDHNQSPLFKLLMAFWAL